MIKKILSVLGFIILLALLYLYFFGINLNNLKDTIYKQVAANSAYKLSIKGNLKAKLSFPFLPTVTAHEISVSSASTKNILLLNSFAVKLSIFPLIFGDIDIHSVELLGTINKKPLNISSAIKYSSDSVRFSSLNAKFAGNDLSGHLDITTKKPYKINGDLKSSKINLSNVLPSTTKKTTSTSEYIFPSEKIPFALAHTLSGNISYNLKNLHIKIKMDNGKIDIVAKDTNLADGTVIASLNANSHTTKINLDLKAKAINLGKLLKTIAPKVSLNGGITNATIKTSYHGQSVKELMANANGKILITVGKGTLNNVIDLAGENILSSTIGAINPFKGDKTSILECSVVHFKIENGIAHANNGIAAMTDQVSIIGSGKINLKTESIDFDIIPKTRNAEIPLPSLADLVKISGTLTEPAVVPNPVGIIKEVGTLAAASATGGLSSILGAIVESAVTRQQDDGRSPCEIAKD